MLPIPTLTMINESGVAALTRVQSESLAFSGVEKCEPLGRILTLVSARWRRYAHSNYYVICNFGPWLISSQANALVNTAIDDCSIPSLRAVVLDELHMIDDDHRGYLLELTATKLLALEQPIQIIGMSATLPVCFLDATSSSPNSFAPEYEPHGSMARWPFI